MSRTGRTFLPTNTEVIAIAIPGLNKPQSFFDPEEKRDMAAGNRSSSQLKVKRKLHTTYLMDCMLDTVGDKGAVESDAMHAIIAHQWRHFGYAYAVEEAVYYIFFFVVPLVDFTVSLDAMPSSTNNEEYREIAAGSAQWNALLSLAVSTVWIIRQLLVEKKQHYAGDSKVRHSVRLCGT